jgi:hypothetical protein
MARLKEEEAEEARAAAEKEVEARIQALRNQVVGTYREGEWVVGNWMTQSLSCKDHRKHGERGCQEMS